MNEPLEKIKSLDDGSYEVLSSKGDDYYTVTIDANNEYHCECKANIMKGIKCRHIQMVLDSVKTEANPDEPSETPEDETEEQSDQEEIELAEVTIPEKYIHYMKHKIKDTGKYRVTPFILFDGLMYLARRKGFKKLFAEMVQAPNTNNDNRAICSAYLLTKDGQEFRDIGDADITNVKNKLIQPHILRMAATRAKARVLRTWIEVDMVCVEELSSDKEELLIEGKIDLKQQNTLWELYKKFDFPNKEKISIKTWTVNLSIGDGDFVIAKINELESFDYSDFVTIKDEVSNR